MAQLLCSPSSLEGYRDKQTIAMHAYQFYAVSLRGAGQDGAAHQRYLGAVAGTEMSKPEAMPHFVRDGALLPFRRHLREPGVIHGNLTGRYDLGAGRIRHNSQVVVKSLYLDGRGWKPDTPHHEGNGHHHCQRSNASIALIRQVAQP